MTKSIDFESIRVGDEIPPFVRRTHLEEWNRYAAVNDEFIPIHMDDEAGRAAGNEAGAFGMGNLRLAYLVNMLRDWVGADGEIVALSVKYRAMNQKGDVLRSTGKVTGKEIKDGRALVYLDVDVVNQDEKSSAPGQATVAVAG